MSSRPKPERQRRSSGGTYCFPTCEDSISPRRAKKINGAIEGTRTPTPLRVHGPEPCASANSATMALWTYIAAAARRPPIRKTYFSILQTQRRLSNHALRTDRVSARHRNSETMRSNSLATPQSCIAPSRRSQTCHSTPDGSKTYAVLSPHGCMAGALGGLTLNFPGRSSP